METVARSQRGRQASSHGNSFDAIRLGAALTVVIGHAFVLTGHGAAPKIGGIPIHALGVDVFFVVSGFLISDSWFRDPHLGRYFARRFLRILPALLCVVLLTVIVIGPMLTISPIDQYWSAMTTWAYLQNLALIGVYDLPGVFVHGHWTSAVNGSLWTLGLEFTGYAVIALAAALPSRRPTWPIIALLAIAITLVALHGIDTGLGAAGRVWIFFALGALARRHAPTRLFSSLPLAASLLGIWLIAAATAPPVGAVLAWVAVPHLTLTLGHRATEWSWVTSLGDLSYGTYLWGFLVQQIVIERFGNLPVPTDLLLVTPITLGIAWLSWHNIEAPALARRPRPRARQLPSRPAQLARLH